MKILVLTLLAVFSFVSCNGQGGGLGFWNDQEGPPDPENLNRMYEGYILARLEGGMEYIYMLPVGKHCLVKYKVSPELGPGVVILGTFETPGELIEPTEIKEAGGHLFVLDRGGTRITRINLSDYNDKSVIFDNASTPYPLWSMTPLLQPGDPVSQAQIFGVYSNADTTIYYQSSDSLVTEYTGPGNRIDSWFLLTEVVSSTKVKLRTGIPWDANGMGIGFVELGGIDVKLTQTLNDGVNRIVAINYVFNNSGKLSIATVLNSNTLRYGLHYSYGEPVVVISSFYLPPFSTDQRFLTRSPSIQIGTYRGVVSSQTIEYGRYAAIHWEDGTTTAGPNFNALYWSPVIGSSSPTVYVISWSAAPGQKMLYRLTREGTWQFVRGLVN